MRLYLDDDAVNRAHVAQLRQAAHDVQVPNDIGYRGETDARHLAIAVQQHRVLLSYNYDDFEDLHVLVTISGGSHSGILIIRRDNDRKRHMSPGQVVRAVARSSAEGIETSNSLIVLNHWQ